MALDAGSVGVVEVKLHTKAVELPDGSPALVIAAWTQGRGEPLSLSLVTTEGTAKELSDGA